MSDTPDLTPDDERDEVPLSDMLPNRSGRLVSYKGLIERIIEQFHDEFEESFVAQVDSDVQKRILMKEVAEYIFNVEGVQLSFKQQAEIIQIAYSEAIGFGGLDAYFADDTITTIAIEGIERIGVRYKPGSELMPQPTLFEDSRHLKRIVQRLLNRAGADLQEGVPIFEVGLTVNQRPLCLNVAVPPYVTALRADIRLHPAILPTLDDLVAQGFLNEKAKVFLLALVRSEHGFVIVGDTESGKTTLLSVLAQFLPNPEQVISIERAGELRLPTGATQKTVQWAYQERANVSFGERVLEALAEKPACVLLDEVRSDEPQAIAPLLQSETAPRQIWSCRGSSEAKRIRSALGMIARMADGSQPEAMADSLYQRLPFVVLVKRRRGSIQLMEIAEWQYPDGATYPDFVELLTYNGETLVATGKHAQHPLDLPDAFWATNPDV